MRLFIAINFPQNIKAKILKQVIILKKQFPRISWVREENLHLTLKFLGYTKDEKLERIKKGIEVAVRDFKPFEMSISHFGYFTREPFIIRLNVDYCETLIMLADRLEKEMGSLGFRRENRPYNPHITLARGKRLKREEMEALKSAIQKAESLSIKFRVEEIVLMQSQLTPAGSIYTVLDTYKLSV